MYSTCTVYMYHTCVLVLLYMLSTGMIMWIHTSLSLCPSLSLSLPSFLVDLECSPQTIWYRKGDQDSPHTASSHLCHLQTGPMLQGQPGRSELTAHIHVHVHKSHATVYMHCVSDTLYQPKSNVCSMVLHSNAGSEISQTSCTEIGLCTCCVYVNFLLTPLIKSLHSLSPPPAPPSIGQQMAGKV